MVREPPEFGEITTVRDLLNQSIGAITTTRDHLHKKKKAPTRIYDEQDHTVEGLEVFQADLPRLLLQQDLIFPCSSIKTSYFLQGKSYWIKPT